MVSHDELDAAAEEATETVETTEAEGSKESQPETLQEPEAVEEQQVEQQQPEKDQPEEQVPNYIKATLGRISAYQSKIDNLEHIVQQLLEEKQGGNQVDSDNDDYIASKEDVIRVMREEKAQEENQKQQYNKEAENAMLDLSLEYTDISDKKFVDIFKDATSKWKRITGDPHKDAEINFKDAYIRHLHSEIKKTKTPVNPLEKNKDADTEALGGAVETNVKPKNQKPIELDDAAKDFVKRTKMKDDDVRKALNGPMPAYLSGVKT